MQQLLTVPIITLTVVSTILWIIVGLVLVWQLYVAVHGCGKLKPRQKIENKQYCFAILICARNEEDVIGQLIDSLFRQNYPRDRFDVFVVADNCDDATAKVARQHGAFVYERQNKEEVGKGYALRWALDKLKRDYGDRYDAVTLFDADNLVDADYLYHTNEALCTGADATQGYRETKNPFESVVSGCYAIYWYMLSRFYHQARSNMGKPCSIGGTGFAFKTHIIEKDGWYTTTLTEDSEFASRKVLEGYYIQFVREALFYDEQPTKWDVSFKQRLRWMCGIMQETRTLLKPAVVSFKNGNKNAFDIIMFLLSVPALAVVFVAGALSLIVAILSTFQLFDQWYIYIGGTLLSVLGGTYFSVFAAALFSVVSEKGKVGKFWPAVLTYPVFMAPMTFFMFICLFKKDMKWEQIKHSNSSTIDDMDVSLKKTEE